MMMALMILMRLLLLQQPFLELCLAECVAAPRQLDGGTDRAVAQAARWQAQRGRHVAAAVSVVVW